MAYLYILISVTSNSQTIKEMGRLRAQPRATTCMEHGRCPEQKPSTTWSAPCRRTKARKSTVISPPSAAPKSDSIWARRRFGRMWVNALIKSMKKEKRRALTLAQVPDPPTIHLMTPQLPPFSQVSSPIQKTISRIWKTLNRVFTQEGSERAIEASSREHPKIKHATSTRSQLAQLPSSLFKTSNSRLRRTGTEIDKENMLNWAVEMVIWLTFQR